jgi:hypothetical protein
LDSNIHLVGVMNVDDVVDFGGGREEEQEKQEKN